MRDDERVLPCERYEGSGGGANVPPLVLGGHGFAASQESVASEGDDHAHRTISFLWWRREGL
jgi:hypothetical protein